MKTTIQVSDALLRAAKDMAAAESTTLRALVEEGLRHVIGKRARRRRFRLRKVTYRGRGPSPEFAGAGWERVRSAIYEEHET
jgi:hypothetical protein